MDRAQRLFRAASIPRLLHDVIRQAFAARNIHGTTTKTVLARVLAAAQTRGFEAAVQTLESFGIRAPMLPPVGSL